MEPDKSTRKYLDVAKQKKIIPPTEVARQFSERVGNILRALPMPNGPEHDRFHALLEALLRCGSDPKPAWETAQRTLHNERVFCTAGDCELHSLKRRRRKLAKAGNRERINPLEKPKR